MLTEKLTLARELSSLRPEVDHLRSQAVSHQALLAEKLSLQRQLSTIQVELETEKRSINRVLAKEKMAYTEDIKVESRLETLQRELAKERRDRQKHECEARKAYTDSESKISTLESRLDAFRTKLKTTKEQLKETQAALESAQDIPNTSTRGKKPNDMKTTLAKHLWKRPAAQIDADTMIGTPGDLPAAKKSRRASCSVGEKSTFSITPFLNRTVSIALESPHPGNAGSDGEDIIEPHSLVPGNDQPDQLPKFAAQSSQVITSTGQTIKRGILGNAKASRANSIAPSGRKAKTVPALEEVAEEGDVENNGSTVPVFAESAREGLEKRKRKRKLLGGGFGETLFDKDEGGAAKSDGNLMEGVRSFGTLARGGLAGPKFGSRKTVGPSMGTFGAISPLKRDRENAA